MTMWKPVVVVLCLGASAMAFAGGDEAERKAFGALSGVGMTAMLKDPASKKFVEPAQACLQQASPSLVEQGLFLSAHVILEGNGKPSDVSAMHFKTRRGAPIPGPAEEPVASCVDGA